MKYLHAPLLAISIAACLAASPCSAQEARAEVIQKIAASQGLFEMFEQQLVQQRDSMKGYAAKLFEQTTAETGMQPNAKEKAAFERFLAKAPTVFSATEITSMWTANYGKDLSVQELQGILKYYDSPIGRKDVAASKAAMISFSTWMNQEAQVRSTTLIKEMLQELQAARP
jgi:hypothetical protein